jgi:hypothetical protein
MEVEPHGLGSWWHTLKGEALDLGEPDEYIGTGLEM